MKYIECKFTLANYPIFYEVLIALLSELQFESFQEEEPHLYAYIEESAFDEKLLLNQISSYSKIHLVHAKEMEQINWNEEWEKNYQPLSVDDFCYIRAPFHDSVEGYTHELVIEPKMSFGTGHHATTRGMIRLLKQVEWKKGKVLDLGSGTGILAILASKMGAKSVIATDIEDWAYENMQENFQRNHCREIRALKGSLPLKELDNEQFDLLLANINKNVLLEQIQQYTELLDLGAKLFLSGFYSRDLKDIEMHCKANQLFKVHETEESDWMAVAFERR